MSTFSTLSPPPRKAASKSYRGSICGNSYAYWMFGLLMMTRAVTTNLRERALGYPDQTPGACHWGMLQLHEKQQWKEISPLPPGRSCHDPGNLRALWGTMQDRVFSCTAWP